MAIPATQYSAVHRRTQLHAIVTWNYDRGELSSVLDFFRDRVTAIEIAATATLMSMHTSKCRNIVRTCIVLT